MGFSFFSRDADDREVAVPEPVACSLWSDDQMHGVALSGLLAHRLERTVAELGRDDLRPARYTVDLFRPAAMKPCTTRATVVRESRRLCLLDSVVEQDGVAVARASALFLKATEPPDGAVWEPDEAPQPPPEEVAPVSDEPRVPLFASDGKWTDNFGDHQNAGRKTTWQTAVPVFPDEELSTFVAVASIADATSMVTNWGSNGVEQINTDITLTLGRLPVSREVGLHATDRVSADGIAVGTATVFDRAGRVGTSVVTSVANARRTVSFDAQDFDPRSAGA